MQAHQELSAITGAVTGTSVQTVSTSPAVVAEKVTQEEVTQEEEKKETHDKEEFAIQTLVELPKLGIPTKTI